MAKDGKTAFNIANRFHPNLILLDIMMPGIDGYEVCRRLKDDPTTSDIPIIFLSALGDTEDKVKGLELGAVDYISKPFQPEEVLARVNTHLTIRRLSREVQDQRDQLENELQVVSEIQRELLVKKIPAIDGIECAVHYECRTVHRSNVDPTHLAGAILDECYARGDFHTIYYGQILGVSADEDAREKLTT